MSPARLAGGRSDEVTLSAGLDRTDEDGQLRWGADPAPEQLQLALHVIETKLGFCELGTQLSDLAPESPGARAEVETRRQEQANPDQQPPPHEAGPYPFATVDGADSAETP
jgi:hypothetical protein